MATKYKYNEKRKEWSTLVYDGTLTPTGEKHRKRITSKKSSRDLENKVNAFKASLDSSVKASNITFGEYAKQWLELYASNKEIYTQLSYKSLVRRMDDISDVRLCDLSRSHLQSVINLYSDRPRTCQLMKQVMKSIVESAVIDKYLSNCDNMLKLSLPKRVKKEKQPLTPVESEALLNCDLSEKERAFVTILYYTGVRRGEALALTASDFTGDSISINKAIVYNNSVPVLKPHPKSDNGVRVIPLSEEAQRILKPYVANCTGVLFKGEKYAYMCTGELGTMWRHIEKKVNEYAGEKIHITPHQLRHNFCSLLCYQVPRISTKTIARLLGDTEAMVLKVYSHIMDDKEDVAGALESAFKSNL